MSVPGVTGPDRGGLLDRLRAGEVQGEAAKLRAATNLLESVFVGELYKAMRDTVPTEGLMSGGTGESIFSGMLDQHVAEISAGRFQRGLGQALYDQFRSNAGVPDSSSSGEDL